MTIGFGLSADVWIYEWARDRLTKLTFGSGPDTAPVWTPDGRRIAYASASGKEPRSPIFSGSDPTAPATRSG